MYIIEKYKNHTRYSRQYDEIYQFLLKYCDNGSNEHFHWARFEWMMGHLMLEEDNLDKIVIFKDCKGTIVGLIVFDTVYDDKYYLIHSGKEAVLREMIDHLTSQSHDPIPVKVNSGDQLLIKLLQEKRFKRIGLEEQVLQISLKDKFIYELAGNYHISPKDFVYDKYSCQLVIHKGFENEGEPEENAGQYFMSSPHTNNSLKVFAFDDSEYCAHCGIWYTEGETAYIEPVVTVPRCRKQGLAKAVVYEALNRARESGAKRAVVLSGQEFYYRIGFEKSSEFYRWEKC